MDGIGVTRSENTFWVGIPVEVASQQQSHWEDKLSQNGIASATDRVTIEDFTAASSPILSSTEFTGDAFTVASNISEHVEGASLERAETILNAEMAKLTYKVTVNQAKFRSSLRSYGSFSRLTGAVLGSGISLAAAEKISTEHYTPTKVLLGIGAAALMLISAKVTPTHLLQHGLRERLSKYVLMDVDSRAQVRFIAGAIKRTRKTEEEAGTVAGATDTEAVALTSD
ncbi:MAG TPA: hypothetical protein VIH90_03405 [Candidatus Saccharimonadales bacterium]